MTIGQTAIVPPEIPNWIAGAQRPAQGGKLFDKLNPHDGQKLCQVARSGREDIAEAVQAAKAAWPRWAALPPVQRGNILHTICNAMEARREEIARIVRLETGKSFKDALGETEGAIACGRFFAGEGQRLFGRTIPSAAPGKYNFTIRQPCGVAGLIVPANTPIANVAWKIFPAMICGNSVVLKAAEDTPATAWIVAAIAQEAGLPRGVLDVVQGFGPEAGQPLVEHEDVAVVSFTGSTAVGKLLAEIAARRLAKISLELGGKNPLVVCDDADLEYVVRWVCLSAFSNAGQRCAAGSRIIVFDTIYDRFRNMLVEATRALKLGPEDGDHLGPVINERQLNGMLTAIAQAEGAGARVLIGGRRLTDPSHAGGFYMAPTLIDNVAPDDEISMRELFGPITCLYRARDFNEALLLANNSPYGLTACIHTRSLDRALQFCYEVQSGVAVVNAGTHGSEPHIPFGGLKQSGNSSREPGTEALDIYSNLKNVCLNVDPRRI